MTGPASAATVSNLTAIDMLYPAENAFTDTILNLAPPNWPDTQIATAGLVMAPVQYYYLGGLLVYAGIFAASLPRARKKRSRGYDARAADAIPRTR